MKSLLTTCLAALLSAGAGPAARPATQVAGPSRPIVTASPAQVVNDFLTAYQAGNHERVAALLHPQVRWQQPGQNRLSGTKTTRAEVLQLGRAMQELSAHTIRLVRVEYVGASGQQVACVLHWQGAQPPGGLLHVANIDVYTVAAGRITQVQVFSADLAQENRFWGTGANR